MWAMITAGQGSVVALNSAKGDLRRGLERSRIYGRCAVGVLGAGVGNF